MTKSLLPSHEAQIQASAAAMVRAHNDKPRELITPGLPFQPTFIPYCQFCKQPVRQYCVELPKDPYRISIDAQCCGRHQGAHVRIEDLRQVLADGGKFFAVTRPGQYQRVVGENVRAEVAG